MAVVPLFVASMEVLKEGLRLNGASTTDALAVIDEEVLEVRVGFFDRLGATRITQIVAYTNTDTPATDNEITRTRANRVESKWCRLRLLRRIPVLFVDASGQRQRDWNEEAAFSAGPEKFLRGEIEKLEGEVEQGLAELEGEASVEDPIINVSTIGPDTPPDLPGASVWPNRRR